MKSTTSQTGAESVPLTRLSDMLAGKADGCLSPIEAQAATLLAKVASPPPLSPQTLARLGDAIAKPPASSAGWLIGGGLGLIAAGTLATLLWSSSGSRSAVMSSAASTDAVTAIAAGEARPAHPAAQPSTEDAPAASSDTKPSESLAVQTPSFPSLPSRSPAHSVRRSPSLAVSKPASQATASSADANASAIEPPPESELAIESRLLGLVIRELRQNKDPKQALVRLDEYAARFPSGLLHDEAQAARVDALLLSGQRAEALAILERVSFARLPRGGELRVLRGELRAASGRCQDALADFVASSAMTADVAERALYGQGMCRAHLGDVATAEADLRAYLSRFPSGRFKDSAQTTLRNLSANP